MNKLYKLIALVIVYLVASLLVGYILSVRFDVSIGCGFILVGLAFRVIWFIHDESTRFHLHK